MSNTICGADCAMCQMKNQCGGCIETKGHPFKGECLRAKCCLGKGYDKCNRCSDTPCRLKEKAIAEINGLGIKDMAKVTELNELRGAFINLEYTFPSGQSVKMWDDNKIYLGNQICKEGSDRFYGVTADENYLLVCEYGDCGSDAEIILYKKREL